MLLKKLFFTSVIFIFSQTLFAQIPDGYYDSATGTGFTLKTQLHNIIKNGHIDNGYGALYSAYEQGDTDPEDGFVWDMYSENPDGADPYNFTHYENQCGNYQNEGDCYNREHLFPQGVFNEAYPMKSDYHHVVPSDGKVNGMRNNYPFGEVNNPSWTSLNGSKRGTCNHPDFSGTVFEPIDEFKGDIARSMFYFATRYEDRISSWTHEMLNGTSNQVYTDWFIEILLNWHNQDPVSSKEITRNNVGYNYQNNRNPFIDHPEFVAQIWGGGENVPPSITNIAISPQNPTSAESVTVSATITDADGAITSTLLNWGLNAGSLSNTINMSNSTGDNYVADAPIPAQADGTTVYYTIEAEDDSAAINTSSIQSYTVNDEGAVGLPFAEDFETVTEDQPVDINGWTQYIEAGTETWEGREYVGNLYAQFSAYNTGEYINIGWLITPALDLTGYSEVIFSFKSKDGYNNGDPLDVFISSDYSGSGDPNGSSWIELNPVLSTGNTEGYATNWTASGDLSLNNYTGNTVYIAFKYTGGDPSLTTTMQIDDVLVEENYIANEKPVISNIQHTPETPASEDGVTVSATITDPDGTITNAELNWGLSTGNLSNTISMSDAGGDVYSSDTEIPPQTEGTTIYYAIKATDNSEGITISEENSYQVTDMDNQAPVISNVFIEPENPTDEDDVIISASVDDEDGNIESVILKWKKNEEVYVEQDMSFTEGKYSGQILKQPAGAMIHFIILAKDDLGAETNYEDSYEVSEANTIERVKINQAKIFPNPSTGIINIVIPGYTGMLDLKLYDAIGALVFAEAKASFNQKDVTYLHGIEKGVYFLKMSTQSGVTVTRRLIVNY